MMWRSLFCGHEGEGEQGDGDALANDAGLHQLVAVFFVEFPALGHQDDTGDKGEKGEDHGDPRENKSERVHGRIISRVGFFGDKVIVHIDILI